MSSWDDILTEQLTHDISIDQQQPLTQPLTTPLSREQDRRSTRIRAERSRLQGGLWGPRFDDAGVFQGVLEARCMGPRDANWR